MQKIKFTRIAGWIATVIGAGAVVQGIALVGMFSAIKGSIGDWSVGKLIVWLLGMTLINFGQLFVGVKILKGKEKARQTILAYQLFYVAFIEIFNILMTPNNDFINNYGFLGVLIAPALISLLILLGRKEELPSDFKVE